MTKLTNTILPLGASLVTTALVSCEFLSRKIMENAGQDRDFFFRCSGKQFLL